MNETWRCFVAVPVPARLREELSACVRAWRDDSALADLRWTDPASWHLTLAFLGAARANDVESIAAALHGIAGATTPFTAYGGELGAFPSAREARVVWYGVEDADEQLLALTSGVHAALGIETQRRFRGHLTLARSRQRFGGPNLVDWLGSTDAPQADITVDRLVLFRSHLGRGPARYESLTEAVMRTAVAHV